jgi:chorismate mutase/prephenate dehydratase
MDLDQLRLRLDAIDGQVLALLSERARAVLDIGDYKRKHGLPIHVPERESGVVKRLQTDNPGPLHGDAIERIYRTIIEEMRKLEEEHVGRVDESGKIKTTLK